MKKTVCVLGLGIFGSTIAKTLSENNIDVIAIDKDMNRIDRMKDYVSNAVCLDFTDIDELKAAGVGDADVGVVTCGTMLEETIIGISNLKKLGVNHVIAKAKNKLNSEVLYKVGADLTISPEKEVGITVAKKIASNNILELFDVDKDYTIYDIKLPKKFQNKSLIELDLRKKYDVNVIGVRRNGKLIINFDPNDKLNINDEIMIIGPNNLLTNNSIFK